MKRIPGTEQATLEVFDLVDMTEVIFQNFGRETPLFFRDENGFFHTIRKDYNVKTDYPAKGGYSIVLSGEIVEMSPEYMTTP